MKQLSRILLRKLKWMIAKLWDVSNRFGICVTDGDALATFSKGFVPNNTKHNMQWAV